MNSELSQFFSEQSDVIVAILYGSRAREEGAASDWDLAVMLSQTLSSPLDRLARFERLRSGLAKSLNCVEAHIDLIDLQRAPLNLCITVATEGKIIKGAESIELFRFYQRAWSGQEEFHYRKANGL